MASLPGILNEVSKDKSREGQKGPELFAAACSTPKWDLEEVIMAVEQRMHEIYVAIKK